MNFDNELELQRIKLDPQELPVIYRCDDCGTEIYQGQEYYDCPTGYLCEDCFDEMQWNERQEYERIAGEEDG